MTMTDSIPITKEDFGMDSNHTDENRKRQLQEFQQINLLIEFQELMNNHQLA